MLVDTVAQKPARLEMELEAVGSVHMLELVEP
jgi:hypothetical protein